MVAAVAKKLTKKRPTWAPDRMEIIWIDCNPQVGRGMRDIHPFLVLSPKIFNEKTSLAIGLPMTTAEYNVDNPFAVAIGVAKGRKAGKTSYVLCHQPKSFDWRKRTARASTKIRVQGTIQTSARTIKPNYSVGLNRRLSNSRSIPLKMPNGINSMTCFLSNDIS